MRKLDIEHSFGSSVKKITYRAILTRGIAHWSDLTSFTLTGLREVVLTIQKTKKQNKTNCQTGQKHYNV